MIVTNLERRTVKLGSFWLLEIQYPDGEQPNFEEPKAPNFIMWRPNVRFFVTHFCSRRTYVQQWTAFDSIFIVLLVSAWIKKNMHMIMIKRNILNTEMLNYNNIGKWK